MLLSIFEVIVFAIYLLSLTCIVVYSLGQAHLVYLFIKNRKHHLPEKALEGNDVPFVTIQLPIYNERYVVERLLDACAAQDYPKDKFEIQLLDDSNDETLEIAAAKVAELTAQGYLVEHVRRPERTGFKAGALAYGLDFAKGDFVAIFDADFLPRPEHLRTAMAQFTAPDVGVVQARWEHINRSYSMFTEMQAFHLDAHFTVEQLGRNSGGMCINFNGTAGIWRKETIRDAGNWQADTLTEDLDLSYRAQIKGWRFRYIDALGAPAELPAEMGAIKSQQYRWMKGGAEVARKMLGQLWRSELSFMHKVHGTLHLLSSSVFVVVLLLGASSVPLIYLKHAVFDGKIGFLLVPVMFLIASFFSLGIFYLVTMLHREKNLFASLRRWGLHYLPFLSLSMGMSLHNTIAVLQGFSGKKTPFIRTPKFNIVNKADRWQHVTYKNRKIKPSVFAELLMAAYFGLGIYFCIHFDDMAVLPFLVMQSIGFATIGAMSVRHAFS
ncbi:MAG: glycosyltransferase [Bacteroidia bacterium]